MARQAPVLVTQARARTRSPPSPGPTPLSFSRRPSCGRSCSCDDPCHRGRATHAPRLRSSTPGAGAALRGEEPHQARCDPALHRLDLATAWTPSGRHHRATAPGREATARRVRKVRSASANIHLEPARYHAWRRASGACGLDDRSSCPRTSPGQLTAVEVSARLAALSGVASRDSGHHGTPKQGCGWAPVPVLRTGLGCGRPGRRTCMRHRHCPCSSTRV